LLKQVQAYFGGVGKVRKAGKDNGVFMVRSLEEITNKIIPHFDNCSLITQKHADYLLFREVVAMMNRKEHLSHEGLQKVINIRATLNEGLTPELKKLFLVVFRFRDP
jgi:hypothetical protein